LPRILTSTYALVNSKGSFEILCGVTNPIELAAVAGCAVLSRFAGTPGSRAKVERQCLTREKRCE
jgi:hypothetical protein